MSVASVNVVKVQPTAEPQLDKHTAAATPAYPRAAAYEGHCATSSVPPGKSTIIDIRCDKVVQFEEPSDLADVCNDAIVGVIGGVLLRCPFLFIRTLWRIRNHERKILMTVTSNALDENFTIVRVFSSITFSV